MTLTEIKSALKYPNMTIRQIAVLCLLYKTDIKLLRKQALELGIPKPAVTRAWDGLCDKHLMKRERVAEDQRSAYAVLTEEGRILAEKIMT